MARSKRPSEKYLVRIAQTAIPVQVFYEYRRNVRVASGKDCVYLRIPKYCSSSERKSFKEWCEDWVRQQWESNARFRTTFSRVDIFNGAVFTTNDTTFSIAMETSDRKSAAGDLSGTTFNLSLPADWSAKEHTSSSYRLIHRLLADRYQPQFKNRCVELHGGHFSKPVDTVKLRNMSSKWGSCSSTGKMTFSTRLLFAPQEVQDYVIIHELCHFDELNHSQRFWDLVESHDPAYTEKERWLKDEGHLCDLHLLGNAGDGQLSLFG